MDNKENKIVIEKRTPGKAIAAMVCGILSIFLPGVGFILSILGIVFGISVRKEIKQWEGMALAGFICGIIGFIFNLIILWIILRVMKIITEPYFWWYLTKW